MKQSTFQSSTMVHTAVAFPSVATSFLRCMCAVIILRMEDRANERVCVNNWLGQGDESRRRGQPAAFRPLSLPNSASPFSVPKCAPMTLTF